MNNVDVEGNKWPEGVNISYGSNGGIIISSRGCITEMADPLFGTMMVYVNSRDLPRIKEHNRMVRQQMGGNKADKIEG